MRIEDEASDPNGVARRLLYKAAESRAWKDASLLPSDSVASEKALRSELEALSINPEVEALRTYLKEKPIGVNCGIWLHRRETLLRIGIPLRYYQLGFRFLLFTSKGFEVAEKTYHVNSPLHEPWESHFQELRPGAEVPAPRFPVFRGLTDAHCRKMIQAGFTVERVHQALGSFINLILDETIFRPR